MFYPLYTTLKLAMIPPCSLITLSLCATRMIALSESPQDVPRRQIPLSDFREEREAREIPGEKRSNQREGRDDE